MDPLIIQVVVKQCRTCAQGHGSMQSKCNLRAPQKQRGYSKQSADPAKTNLAKPYKFKTHQWIISFMLNQVSFVLLQPE